MKTKQEETQRVKYLVDIKIIKNIKKGMNKYSVSDMRTDLKEVRWFLTCRGFHDEARLVNKVMNKIGHLDTCEEEVLNALSLISNDVHQVEEKEKEMNKRSIYSRIKFREMVDKMVKEKKKGTTLQKYDVVKIPTQGGFHCSIVYDIICDDKVLCYPITTSSNRSLRMLGNRSHTLLNSGCPEYDGYRLTSAATYVSIQKASFTKIGHIKNHEEIDDAIRGFDNY